MDWNSINESGTTIWTLIGALGGTTILSILTFIKTSVSGKKFTKVSDFAVVADKSIKFAKSEIVVAKEQLVTDTKKEIVGPMKEMIEKLSSDNAQLASLTVSLLSYIPLPLEVKKDAVAVIGALGNISDGAKTLYDTAVKYQEKRVVAEQKQDTKLQNNIDNI